MSDISKPDGSETSSEGSGVALPKGDPSTYDLEPAPEPDKKPVARISDKPFLDEFDEDADFDSGTPGPATKAPKIAPVEDDVELDPPFIKPGRGDVQAMAVAGLVAMLVAACVNAAYGSIWYKAVILSLYHSGLFAIAGTLAVAFAARMTQKPLGEIELAAARMLLIVSVCQAIFAADYPIPFTGRVDEVVFTGLAYFGLTGALFRLPKEPLLITTGTHFLFMVLLWVGANIEIWAAPVATVVK